MANTTVNIDIQVQSKSLQDLELELQQINDELKQVPVGSESFKKLSGEAQVITKELQKANKEIEGFTDERKFQAAEGSIKILGGTLAGVVGTLGTLGIESEAFGEFERKAASAIAVAVGFRDVAEGVRQLKTALDAATVAQIKQNAAALANPYVLVGTAIAGLTVGLAKYVSVSTDDVVPTTEVLSNMFLSFGNNAAFANRMVNSYVEGMARLKEEEDALQMDRAIQVLQAFGEDTIDLEIARGEKQLAQLEENSEEYNDKLTELAVLRAKKAKAIQDKELEDLEKARQKKLEEILFAADAREFAESMYEELAEDDVDAYARGVVKGFDKLKEDDTFDPMTVSFIDPDDEESIEAIDQVVGKFQEGLQKAIDETIANKETWDNFLSVANSAFDSITNLSQQRYERELLYLERERSAIESNAALSEEARTAALEKVAAKEKQLEIQRIKAENDQFTLKQTLLIAEEVMKARFYAMEQIQIAKLNVAKATATAQEIALAGAASVGKAQMSLGAFTAALGPFGVAAFALSIGGIIASIVSAKKKANAQIAALGASGGIGIGSGVSAPVIPEVPVGAEVTPPQTFDVTPTQRAYVLSGDVSSSQEADAKLNTKRTII